MEAFTGETFDQGYGQQGGYTARIPNPSVLIGMLLNGKSLRFTWGGDMKTALIAPTQIDQPNAPTGYAVSTP